MGTYNPIIEEKDDGNYIPKIGSWGLDKYRMIGTFMSIFTNSMSNSSHWKKLIYIDLFSGAGFAKVKKSKKIVRSSALISLSLPQKFDKYIFCEEDPKAFNALKNRVSQFSDLEVKLLNIDSNVNINLVVDEIKNVNETSLCFCFVDPFSINIHFKTIEKLASNFRMDFLILFASDMDIRRNHGLYSDPKDQRVALQLDYPDWRKEYEQEFTHSPQNLIKFIAEKYISKMKNIGYKYNHPHLISNKERNRNLYHLIFFSKHSLGKKFASISSSYSDNQLGFDF